MRKFLSLTWAFIAFILYYKAPNEYNQSYCWLLFLIFLFSSYLLISQDVKSKKFVSFDILFSISFFLTVYVYPLFIYPFDSFYIIGMHVINTDIITKATSLCTLAFSSFAFGRIMFFEPNKIKGNKIIFENSNIKTNIAIYLIFFLFLIYYFPLITNNEDVINFDNGVITSLLLSVVTITLLFQRTSVETKGLFQFVLWNKTLLVILMIVSLLLLFIGDRGLVIMILIIYLTAFNWYHGKINLIKLLPIGVSISLLLYVIGASRGGADVSFISALKLAPSMISDLSIWYILSDLTSISRNIYIGYEYSLNHELFYPSKIGILLFSPIPFFPSLTTPYFFNLSWSDLSTGALLTNYTGRLMNVDFQGGLGTHVVIDAFISFGFWGTIGLFFIFGCVMGYAKSRIYTSYLATIFYITYTAGAIYIPRSTLFFGYDLAIKTLVILYIFKLLQRK
jgi:hypothetical protein